MDKFEVLTDVKRVSTLSEDTLLQMFSGDASSGDTVYIDGTDYTLQSIAIDEEYSLVLTVSEDPQWNAVGTIIVETGKSSWEISHDEYIEEPDENMIIIPTFELQVFYE